MPSLADLRLFALLGLPLAVVVGFGGVMAPTATIGLAAMATIGCIACASPKFGVGLWIFTTAFVPDWTSVAVAGVSIKPIVAVGLPVTAGILLRRKGRVDLKAADWCIAGAILGVALLTALWHYPTILGLNVATLAMAYLLGRMHGLDVSKVYAAVMVVAAIWGIAEFFLDWHVFQNWHVSDTQHWNVIQRRAGWARSEASFGHAIAYGACLAAALPFARQFSRRAGISQLVLVAGIVVSLSRGPMLALVLTLALMSVVAVHARRRLMSLVVTLGAGVAVYLVFGYLQSETDASTTDLSSQQRLVQLHATIDQVRIFGASVVGQLDADNRLSTASVSVIDSTPLRLAVNYGWILTFLLLAPVLIAVWRTARTFRAGPATIALAGQIPVMLVTSLITQWQGFLFFLAGMAATEMARRPRLEDREMSTSDIGMRVQVEAPVTDIRSARDSTPQFGPRP